MQGECNPLFFCYLCSKLVGQQFVGAKIKFIDMVLSYHQTGSQVFKTPPANVDERRERIANEFVAPRRTRMARLKCVELEGGHVEGRN